ncbi:MAG: nuclear transport factor 2 family protein [Solirubrobacterales bacterium]
MLSWLAGKLIAHNMRKLNEGDPAPTVRMYAEDVRFKFPGDNSWSGEIQGKESLRRWLERFADVGIQIRPDEVVAQGWPWRQTVCVRGTTTLDAPGGKRVYENRYVIWGHLAWGKMRAYEVYEDSEKAKALDGYLESVGKLEPRASDQQLDRSA